MFRQLVLRNRSYRRFDQSKSVSKQTLRDLVDFARLSPCAANLQSLRFWLVDHPHDRLFDCLRWANYLKNWEGPMEGERPSAYIIVLAPQSCTKYHYIDTGIACQSMLLGATEIGLGGCMLAAVDREAVQKIFDIPSQWEILLVIALGVPAETVVVDQIGSDQNIEYWRDERDRHHVPKRSLDTLILN
ncbi:MAG: nitroreductase family protein [Candidatus Cloacimonadaceae bacterium]|jgi:nitroreductase|nr:nitroreductase family protein [Candidatus Cloacimonadota bacterium]MDY0126998.1 nitroreductase family protein [Candidatus Cloacimonadaceae bacterium]MCB5255154.1 nitroreductase family protein [Candidatus Cloacimonadota bacterium]MCK9179079.1 nitroreductase family protein [Candidatus Cloacimonadota bacterium]MCK9243503.1 nitroreductase family protein [Candidatus Cloacimonadota bacterium]